MKLEYSEQLARKQTNLTSKDGNRKDNWLAAPSNFNYKLVSIFAITLGVAIFCFRRKNVGI